jgi:hypothetical protein
MTALPVPTESEITRDEEGSSLLLYETSPVTALVETR